MFRLITVVIFISLSLSCLTDNNEEENLVPSTSYSISGTLILPQTFPKGTYMVILDNDWERGNGVIVSVEESCANKNSISYNLKNVPLGGPYYLYAFAPEYTSETVTTHIGYYGSEDGSYTEADSVYYLDSSETNLSGYNINLFSVGISILGRLLTTTEQTGKQYAAYVDSDTDTSNGYISKSELYSFGEGLEHNFGMGGQTAGDYYFYAISEDLIGYYGSSVGSPTQAKKVKISNSSNIVYDITMVAK